MTATLVLAVLIFARRSRLMPPADRLWDKFKEDAPLPLCGGNPSPMTYCRPAHDTAYLDNDATGWVICGYASVGWVGLLFDQLFHNAPSFLRQRFPLLRAGGIPYEYRKTRTLIGVYWFVIQMCLFVLTPYCLSQIVLMARDAGFDDPGNWSFGQLIAVTVWAPTVAKFIYFGICKSSGKI